MDTSLVRFVALLRAAEVRVSTGEALDAARGLAALGLHDRTTVKAVLGATLVKDRRDLAVYSDLFERFFRLEAPGAGRRDGGHDHGHEDLTDDGTADRTTISDEPSDRPADGHSHAKPADVKEFFDDQDMATQYNLHQEANKVDLTSGTDELVLSKDQDVPSGLNTRGVQLETSRLHGALQATTLAGQSGTRLDVDLSVAEEQALADWLATEGSGSLSDDELADLDSFLAELPARLKAHLERLAAQTRQLAADRARPAFTEHVAGAEQDRMDEALRQLGRTLRGALTHRKRVSRTGRIDIARTMRRNLRFDGIPFVPVTTGRQEDRPRLVVLADVSLSVRNAARFTLHMVHGLQRLYPRVRTFVFVSELSEVTEIFEQHPVGDALGLIFGGQVLDVDANSDYGGVFETFVNDQLGSVNRRTSVLVLGDARGNGNEPGLEAFEEISRRALRVVWLTPEPAYSWSLGRCDIGLYANLCERVEVVRDVDALTRVALADEIFGHVRGAR